MTTQRRVHALALVSVIAVVGACGSTSEGASETTQYPNQGFYEKIYGDQDSNKRQQTLIEDKVASCMTAKGWEYQPINPDVAYGGGGDFSFDQDKFRAQWGYGIATVVGHEAENPWGGGPMKEVTPYQDPNMEYVNSLSDSDREAYYADLYGPPDQFSDGSTYDPAIAKGCQPESQYAVMGKSPMFNDKLGQELSKMEENIAADERIVKAFDKWQSCVGDEGFTTIEKPEDTYNYIQSKLNTLMGWDQGPGYGDGAAGSSISAATVISGTDAVTGDTVGVMPIDGPTEGGPTNTPVPDDKKAELAVLQAEEMKLAAADHTCQQKYVTKVMNKVRAEYQDEFLTTYADDLGKNK